MCGRYALYLSKEELEAEASGLEFDIENVEANENAKPRLNIAPHSICWVLKPTNDFKKSEICAMKWSLQPNNTQEKVKYPTFNTRLESLDPLKPTWRPAQKHRCIVLMQGYYEWEPTSKLPYYVHAADPNTKLLCCLGIWNPPSSSMSNSALPTFSVVTMPAPTQEMKELHSRMPIITTPQIARQWIFSPWDTALKLALSLNVSSLTAMKYYRVSNAVNSVKIETPGLNKKLNEKKITEFFARKQPTDSDLPPSRKRLKKAPPGG